MKKYRYGFLCAAAAGIVLLLAEPAWARSKGNDWFLKFSMVVTILYMAAIVISSFCLILRKMLKKRKRAAIVVKERLTETEMQFKMKEFDTVENISYSRPVI